MADKPAEVEPVLKIGTALQVEGYAQPTNGPRARLWELEHTIRLLEVRVSSGGASEALWETKGALQAIHGLEHGGMKKKGWTSAQKALWNGLIGARNAAHRSEAKVIAMRINVVGESRLTWHIEDPTAAIRSKKGQLPQYVANCEGKPVLPQLREVRDLVRQVLGAAGGSDSGEGD